MQSNLFAEELSEDDEIGSKMKEVLDVMDRFSFASFLNSVYHKLKTDEQVRQCTAEVQLCTRKIQMEYERMENEKLKFLNSIVTKDNHCYTKCSYLANKLNGSIKSSREVFDKFHKRISPAENRKRKLRNMGARDEYEGSWLSKPATESMFGMEVYPECVTELFESMKEFNRQLCSIFVLIKEVVNQEAEIRNDREQCYTLLVDFLRECRGYFNSVFGNINGVSSKDVTCPAEIEKMRDENPDDGDFASAVYHNASQGGLRSWMFREMYKIKEAKGLTEVEQYLWGQDVEKVKKIRCAIENFDSLLPKDVTIRNNKLPAKYVAMFMYWCGITNVKIERTFAEYFNEGYSRKGMYELVNYPAVNKAKNSIRNIKYDNDYISLEKRIEYTIKNIVSA